MILLFHYIWLKMNFSCSKNDNCIERNTFSTFTRRSMKRSRFMIKGRPIVKLWKTKNMPPRAVYRYIIILWWRGWIAICKKLRIEYNFQINSIYYFITRSHYWDTKMSRYGITKSPWGIKINNIIWISLIHSIGIVPNVGDKGFWKVDYCWYRNEINTLYPCLYIYR